MKSIRSAIAEISFDEKNLILSVKVMEGAEMTVENTRRHYDIIKQIVGD